jgi:hypothetical protein
VHWHNTKWSNGKRRKDGNHSTKKNSIQNSGGNEASGYLVLDLNKTMINVTKELSNIHKKKNQRNMERYL